jgi:hypothetical protein
MRETESATKSNVSSGYESDTSGALAASAVAAAIADIRELKTEMEKARRDVPLFTLFLRVDVKPRNC